MQFSKNKQFIYFASIVVAFASLVLRNYHYAATSFISCAYIAFEIYKIVNGIKPSESLYRSLKTKQ